MDKDLKIFALEYVQLHDDLLKEEKLAIGEFIMKANDDQVKFMLATGEVKDKLTETDLKYLKEVTGIADITAAIKMWANKPGYEYSKTAQVVKFGAVAALILAAAFRIYKEKYSKSQRACKGKEDKQKCLKEFRINAIQSQIQALKKNKQFCEKTNDPKQCKAKVDLKIAKLEAKIKVAR